MDKLEESATIRNLGQAGASGLVRRMRERTAALHAEAERSGAIAALMAGQLSRRHYALYLRNLLPVYQAMEHALRQAGSRSVFEALAQPSVYRAASLVADLKCLAGADWATALPLLPSGRRYAARVEWTGASGMLLAHCYTRYLGDLSGGQIMGRRLRRLFGAAYADLAFTVFPGIDDVRAFADAYRATLDRVGDRLDDVLPVIDEAVLAFQLNIAVSKDVYHFSFWPDCDDRAQIAIENIAVCHD